MKAQRLKSDKIQEVYSGYADINCYGSRSEPSVL